MTVGKLFPDYNLSPDIKSLEVKGISEDSRLTCGGDLFFVIERKNFNIFSILKDIERKVVAFVGERKIRREISSLIKDKPVILVKDVKKEFRRVIDLFYDFPQRKLKFIGVTGTNGKTTTSYLIYHLLKGAGKRVALIGTVKYYLGERTQKGTLTTPDYLTLRKIFKELISKGIEFVVMEASSQGIVEGRLEGLNFLRCVFTNLSRDHLDYHKTIKNYFEAKEMFFLKNPQAVSIVNYQDRYGRRLLNKLSKKISYGFSSQADIQAKNIFLHKRGSFFELSYGNKHLSLNTKLYGKYNILNILAACGVYISLGAPLGELSKNLASFKGVEGRLEKVGDDIFIDYAHTPQALKKVILTLRQIGYNKVISVFGCGGDRDKGKRKIMGKIASQFSFFSFITTDNPRNEDPEKIGNRIEEGFLKNNYKIILDRKEAIKEAIKLQKKYKNCCLLIAGKGHEDYQIIGDKRIPFKDKKVIKELLDNLYGNN